MKRQSRAMVLTAPGQLEMQVFDLPRIGEEDGLLEVELSGICGSDPAIFEDTISSDPQPYPFIMGHEIVGRVVEIGKAASKRLGVRKGDRAIIEYAFGCGICEPCLRGHYTTCEMKYAYGSEISCQNPPYLFGGYSEYVYLHPRAMVHKIGDEISPEVGVIIAAVLGNAIRWLRQIGGVSIGDAVAIVGPGQQGIAGVAVAKESGAGPIFIIGLQQDKERLEMAKRFGADRVINADEEDPATVIAEITGGKMASVVMDVSGSPSGAGLSLSLAGKMATVVMPGIYKGKEVPLNLDHAVFNEIRLQGVFSQDFLSVGPAIKMARQGRYPFEEMVTHIFPLAEAEKAIRLVAGKEKKVMPVKAALNPKMGL